jgi:hypothetical protein
MLLTFVDRRGREYGVEPYPPHGGRARVGASLLRIGAAPGRSEAQPTNLHFRRERTCDPQGRVRERRSVRTCA